MAGMGSYLDVLRAINESLPDSRSPVTLPEIGRPPIVPLGPATAPPVPFPLGPAPELPPPAPQQPIDPAVVARFTALAGPAPTAPVARRPGRIETLAAIIGGVGAGLQGRGPEYVEAIRERRERPQREYQQRLDDFNARRSQLGLIGTQAAIEQSERRRREIQDRADRQFELEVAERSRQLGLRDQREIELFRDSLLAKREREAREAEERKQQAAFRNQQQVSARLFARDYRKAGAKNAIARELGEYDAGLRDSLSPEAARWESAQVKLEQARANRLGMIGSGQSPGQNAKAAKALAQFESAKQLVVDAVRTGNYQAEQQARRAMQNAFNRLAQFPREIERGFDASGDWPYAKMRSSAPSSAPARQSAQPGPAPAPAAADNEITLEELQEIARRRNISIEQARAQAQAEGLIVR